MRAPPSFLLSRLTRLLVSFIIGMMAGSIIFLYMYGKMMDNILLENRDLHSELIRLEGELEGEQKENEELSKRTQQKLILKKIEIIVMDNQNEPDGFTRTEIIDRLRQDLKFLIGIPLDSIAETSETIYHLIEGKRFEINQQTLQIEVESITVYTTLTLKIRITPYVQPS